VEHIPIVKETIVLQAHLVGHDGIFFSSNNSNPPEARIGRAFGTALGQTASAAHCSGATGRRPAGLGGLGSFGVKICQDFLL